MNNKIEYKNKVQIITKDNQKYIKKKKITNKDNLFNYLKIKDFNKFLPITEKHDDYEIYQYIEEDNIFKEEKVNALVNAMCELHNKTTSFHNVDQDYIDELYNSTKDKLLSLRTYYYELQDYFEMKEFPSPEEQLLLNNISNIYKAINFSEYKLNLWYEKIKSTKKIRRVQLHGDLSVEHILINNETYLISWDKAKQDLPIYDFINFYKNEFNNLEMQKLFIQYQKKYQYQEEEQLLFESLIAIPPKITFKKSHLINTIETRKHIDYLDITNNFLLKDNKENQEDNK